MTVQVQSILKQALELPAADRVFLADPLWDSIHPPGDGCTPEEWHAAAVAELESREAAIASGEMKLIPWEQVKADLDKWRKAV